MHADSATESGKCSRHTSPLNSYYKGKQGKRGIYKLFIWQKVSLRGHLVHTSASESSDVTSWWPVCLVKSRITVKSHVMSCQVNDWAWWWGELPWQCDVIFRRHRGITSQSDGGWPALFTSLSLLTGPGNDTKWHSLTSYFISQTSSIKIVNTPQAVNNSNIKLLFTCNRIWHLAGQALRETTRWEKRCQPASCQWSHLQNNSMLHTFVIW